jgi:hypothetical protein
MLGLATAASRVRLEWQSLEPKPVLRAELRRQRLALKDAQEERRRELVVSGWRSEHRRDEKSGKDRSWS